MSLETESEILTAPLKNIREQVSENRARAETLKSTALEHFNRFAKQEINPRLPEGCRLMPARSITLTEKLYYVIQPGRIKREKTSEAREDELKLIIQDICLGYLRNCPWIAYFDYSNLKIYR